MVLLQPPVIRDTEVFTSMPAHYRRTGMRSLWADANRGGAPVDSFLEGPVFDDLGNLYVTDIPFGRIFRISPAGAWELIAEYDGEPSGTAGRPILAAIDGQGYDRVVVVVTRWYGGIKLGAGGLVRAYGGTAAECLRLAMRRPLVTMSLLALRCPFDDLGVVHAALSTFHADKLDEQFDTEGAALRVQVAADQLAGLKTRLCDATRNRVHLSTPEAA